jgi:uncharacterized membrane protein
MKESKSLHQKIDQLIFQQRIVLIILSALMMIFYLKVQYSGTIIQELSINSNLIQYLLIICTIVLAWQSRKVQQKGIQHNRDKSAQEKLNAYLKNLKRRYKIFLIWGVALAFIFLLIGYKLILAVLLLLIVFTGKEKPSIENLCRMYQIGAEEMKQLKHAHYES